ncbi:MFS transporter [Streptomyces sp. NRRL F-2799]|uniref:MFS transporter n=1 Tax=Streptomyces sp. NRRL F-2799 TaxID=1463844 RepID=UPI0004C91A1B|nr:MFS transporter [Streptomyces sp. NRRL F-2799]
MTGTTGTTGRPSVRQLLRDTDVRRLCLSNLVRTVGSGLVLSLATLYFVTVVHVSAARLGVGLSVAGVLAFLASYPAGVAADRFGARVMTVAAGVMQGLATASYGLATTVTWFVVTACTVAVMEAMSTSARGALVSQVLPPSTRAGARGLMRATNNVGLTVGAGLGAIVLLDPTRAAFLVGLLGAGALQIGGALVCLRLRAVDSPADRSSVTATGHRDLPVLGLVLVNGVLAMNQGVLFVVLPIWLVSRTDIPESFFSMIIVVNTVFVVLFQTKVAWFGETLRGASRSLVVCAAALGVTCLLFAAAAADVGVAVAIALLVAGAITHVVAEMTLAGGSWGAATALSPDHMHGQYLGLFSSTAQIGKALTPVTALALVSALGVTGWIVLAALFFMAALLVWPLVRAAVKSRERYVGQVLDTV